MCVCECAVSSTINAALLFLLSVFFLHFLVARSLAFFVICKRAITEFTDHRHRFMSFFRFVFIVVVVVALIRSVRFA